MSPDTILIPPLILGAVAFYIGLRGYIRLYLYYVPLSLVMIAALLWISLGIPPYNNSVIVALLAMGLFLCACFGMGWLIHRILTRKPKA